MTLHGATPPRGSARVPLSPINEGRFGRMFRRLPPAPPIGEAGLLPLAELMREGSAAPTPPSQWGGPTPPPPVQSDGGDNLVIPSAYTYFGQFVDHDVTFDPNSQLERDNDPDALHNFRTPRFDLDSLYGSGPADEPFLYDRTPERRDHLLLQRSNDQNDLPRNHQGVALIGDPRNDENIIVSQLQVAFLQFHNRLLREVVVPNAAIDVRQRLAEAQRLVRWHYQWVLVHDFLPRIVGRELFASIFTERRDGQPPKIKRRFYRPKTSAYLPVEFSGAAYRYGHSQVRATYDLNGSVFARPIFLPGDNVPELDDLRGRRPLPGQWTLDWSRFTETGGLGPVQPSRLIDTHLTPGLFDLPHRDDNRSLALLNLMRGEALSLPSGQDVAKLLGVDVVTMPPEAPAATPLWFYILKEAELTTGGQSLGKVGGTIVAEVLLGLLEMDTRSYINVAPLWEPSVPTRTGIAENFDLGDLLAYAASEPVVA